MWEGLPPISENPPVPGSLKTEPCPDRSCLTPEPCPALEVDHGDYLKLLRKLRSLDGVKKVFIRSGIRFDYLLQDRDESFLKELCEHHVSGQLKVAPEHVSSRVLALMNKQKHSVYRKFIKSYREMNRKLGKKQYLVPYFISSHPGSTLKDAVELALFMKETGFIPVSGAGFLSHTRNGIHMHVLYGAQSSDRRACGRREEGA